jgi:hypothetical protein
MWPIDILMTVGSRMIIRTEIFEIAGEKYQNLSELAQAMDISVSQIYRVREGKRGINEKFIIGAKMAFPELCLDDLFYLEEENTRRQISRRVTAGGSAP